MSAPNYENRQFTDPINTIEEKFYPAQFPNHWHNYVEVVFCNAANDSGASGKLQINLDTYTLHPGDIAFIWPGELHSIENNSAQTLCALQFHADIITELPDFRSYQALFRRIRHIKATEQPDLANTLKTAILHMINIRRNNTAFGGVENLITLYEMFICLSTHINDLVMENMNRSPELSQTIEKIYASCLYIQENCTSELSLEDVANQAGVSPFYFSRIFKEEIGVSPLNFKRQDGLIR